MKATLLALGASLMFASPAFAQSGPPPGAGWDAGAFWRGAPDSPRERIRFLQDRIDRGVADGSLNHHEARSASRDLAHIRDMDRRLHYDDGGRLNEHDYARIQGRLDDLSRRIHWLRHNGW